MIGENQKFKIFKSRFLREEILFFIQVFFLARYDSVRSIAHGFIVYFLDFRKFSAKKSSGKCLFLLIFFIRRVIAPRMCFGACEHQHRDSGPRGADYAELLKTCQIRFSS